MLDQITRMINWSIVIAFSVCFSYQAIYFFACFKRKQSTDRSIKKHRYAVLIAARNEQAVIGNLIDSIKQQTYDQEYIDIYVVADNCTDRTAQIAVWKGARCYEHFHQSDIGKGYALKYLLDRLIEERKLEDYDGYFVFDADNILQKDYMQEMNKTFCEGFPVVTSYRNSSNFGQNWISFGYALWFLHESQFLNKGRMQAGTSAMVSGTGYLISTDILKKNQGWKYFLLTEDIEFTADCILHDERIGYCESAVFYDEQPTRIRDSWNQRVRWVKGYYQVFFKYGKELFKKLRRERSLTCFDMLMVDLPAFVVSSFAALSGVILLAGGLITAQSISFVIYSMVMFFLKTFIAMFALGVYTVITERRQIGCGSRKKLLYLFTFPIYMYTYFPIALAAMRKNVTWKPIVHGNNEEICREDWGKSTKKKILRRI